jgi:hypothetical protein
MVLFRSARFYGGEAGQNSGFDVCSQSATLRQSRVCMTDKSRLDRRAAMCPGCRPVRRPFIGRHGPASVLVSLSESRAIQFQLSV